MDVTFERLSGSLSSLLMLWARIEKSVRAEVIRFHGYLPKSAYSISALLKEWEGTVIASQPATSLCRSLATALCAQLEKPLRIRNGLCHGLAGIASANAEEPAKLYWQLNGEDHSISWQELQELFAWLSRIPDAVRLISNPSLERIESRGRDTAENRDWWLMEFAIVLPAE